MCGREHVRRGTCMPGESARQVGGLRCRGYALRCRLSRMLFLVNGVCLFLCLLGVYFIFSPFVFSVGNTIEDYAKNHEHLGSK